MSPEASAAQHSSSRAAVVLAFVTLFGTMVGHSLMETARDALFLAHLPAAHLPVVQLLTVAAGLGLAALHSRVQGHRFLLTGSLVLAAAVAGLLFGLARSPSAVVLYALSVWAGSWGGFVSVQLWLTVARLFPVHRAKRVFGALGAGAAAGAMAGAWAARLAGSHRDAPFLLLAAGVVWAVTAVPSVGLERLVASAPAGATRKAPAAGSGPHVRLLVAIAATSTVALTIADFVWKASAATHVPRNELVTYLANAHLVFSALSLALQLFAGRWLFERVGIRRAVFVVPAALCAGALGSVWGGGSLGAVTFMKGVDGALRYSVHKTSMELLSLPLDDALRTRAKTLVDFVGGRGGQALASLVVLGGLALGASGSSFAGVVVVLCIVWICLAGALASSYVDLFRGILRSGSLSGRDEEVVLDAATLEYLVVALGSRHDRETLAALRMLRDHGKAKLIPPLILFHPSEEVVTEALAIFTSAQRRDVVPTLDRVLAGTSAPAAALRARLTIQPDDTTGATYLDASDGRMAAVAAVALTSRGKHPRAMATIERLFEREDERAIVELARSLATHPHSTNGWSELRLRMLAYRHRSVRAEALRWVAHTPSAEAIPWAIGHLEERATRELATEALRALAAAQECRDATFAALVAALEAPGSTSALRPLVPRALAIAFGPRAAPILLSTLCAEHEGELTLKSLSALELVLRGSPGVELPRAALEAAARRALDHIFSHAAIYDVLSASEQPSANLELLLDLLADTVADGRNRLFRLLGLLHPREDLKTIHRRLGDPRPPRHGDLPPPSPSFTVHYDACREVLEHTVHDALRAAVLRVVDAGRGADQCSRLGRSGPRFASPSEAVHALVAQSTGVLAVAAAEHARERVEVPHG